MEGRLHSQLSEEWRDTSGWATWRRYGAWRRIWGRRCWR